MQIPESVMLPLFKNENERLRPSGRQLKIHPANIFEDIALGRSVTQAMEMTDRKKRDDGSVAKDELKLKRKLNLHLLVIFLYELLHPVDKLMM